MDARDRRPTAVALGMFLVGSAVTAIAALIVAVRRAPASPAGSPGPVAITIPAAPSEPIASEAEVFRTRAGMTAIPFAARREREAHPRTLETMRNLRAYPGAPPRIPHELTPEEFRTSACNTCHERGGYSRRFDAYVPVTPHPANAQCLQCHVGADELMAIPLLSPDANRRCHQCHGTGGKPRTDMEVSLDWRTTTWPRLAPHEPGQTPPPIPHDLQSSANCLACHAGPSAVAEIRTTHPEWADCRQCHVATDPEAGVFTRTVSAGGSEAEAGR
jgi:cytochrome c-type protein NapB